MMKQGDIPIDFYLNSTVSPPVCFGLSFVVSTEQTRVQQHKGFILESRLVCFTTTINPGQYGCFSILHWWNQWVFMGQTNPLKNSSSLMK